VVLESWTETSAFGSFLVEDAELTVGLCFDSEVAEGSCVTLPAGCCPFNGAATTAAITAILSSSQRFLIAWNCV